MKDFINEYFFYLSKYIIPLHTFSVVVWIGGMILFVVAVYPAMKHMQNEKVMILRSIEMLKRFFYMLIPFIALTMVTGLVMNTALGFERRHPVLSTVIHTKEAVWIFMTLIYLYTFYKCLKAQKLYYHEDYIEAKDTIRLISNYLFPINIFLGSIALYFGALLRT